MKFEIEKSNFKVPDRSTLIRGVQHINVVKYNDYYKVQLVSDEITWSVRFAKVHDVVVFLSSLKPGFIVANSVCGHDIYAIVPEEGTIFYHYRLPENFEETITNLKAKGNEFCSSETIKAYSLGTTKERIKADNSDRVCYNETLKKVYPESKETISKKENIMNFNIIKGAFTFDKKLAFAVNGKFKYLNDAGQVSEVLPQFIMIKDIPALVPTIADKITKGVYYTDGTSLFFAKEDNRVINMETGVVSDILISSIPMTDKVIVYKPLFGNGKFEAKDLIKAQMMQGMSGDNPMAAMMLLGDGDIDFKTMALMNIAGGNKNGADFNSLLPLMLLDKGKDSGMEDFILMQAMAGKGENALLPYLLLKDSKKDEKKDK